MPLLKFLTEMIEPVQCLCSKTALKCSDKIIIRRLFGKLFYHSEKKNFKMILIEYFNVRKTHTHSFLDERDILNHVGNGEASSLL